MTRVHVEWQAGDRRPLCDTKGKSLKVYTVAVFRVCHSHGDSDLCRRCLVLSGLEPRPASR